MTQLDAGQTAEPLSEPIDRGRLFWGVVVALSVTVIAVAFWVPGVAEGYQAGEMALHEWVASLFPESLHGAVMKGAHIFLTPWLYLVMMIAFFAERLFPVDRSQPFFSVGFVQDLIGWFIFNSVMRIVLIGVFVKTLVFVLERYLPFLILIEPSVWHPVVAVVAGLVLVDFLNWFHHYVRHKVPLLWSFHAIHHSQKQMNIFTELRVHVFEYVIAKPIVLIPLFMLGLGELAIMWVVVILTAYSQIYHANIRSDFGPLRHVLVTPQSHRIHHSADPRHEDLNYGVIFCVWDKLFGTHWHDHTEYPQTGVYDQAFPCEERVTGMSIFTNYARQFIYPFQVIVHAMRGKGWKLDTDKSAQRHDATPATEPAAPQRGPDTSDDVRPPTTGMLTIFDRPEQHRH